MLRISFGTGQHFPLEQHGLCRALSYIIQTLSAEPIFGPWLIMPIKAQLPLKWNTSGTAGDFMINVCESELCSRSIAFQRLAGSVCHRGYDFRKFELSLSCTYNLLSELCAVSQESHCDLVYAPYSAFYILFGASFPSGR